MEKVRVLITGSGTVTCQSVIKGLRNQSELDAYIVTTDPNPRSAGRYFSNKFYTVPQAKEPNFLDELLAIVRREKIDLLIPIVDYEFMKIASAKAEIERCGCKVAISSPETIAISNEKEKTYAFFRQNGIPTPRTYSAEELKEPDALSYPLFIKPRAGRASLDTYKITTRAELEYYLKLVDDPLVQDLVEGDEYTIDVLSDFDARVLGVVPRQRIETKVGVSYKGITIRDEEMSTMAKLICERLRMIGHCNIQCFRTRSGLVFFEINPRYSGTLALTLAAGLNSPLLLAMLALGHPVEPQIGNYQDGVLMLRYWEEVFVKPDGAVLKQPKLQPVE